MFHDDFLHLLSFLNCHFSPPPDSPDGCEQHLRIIWWNFFGGETYCFSCLLGVHFSALIFIWLDFWCFFRVICLKIKNSLVLWGLELWESVQDWICVKKERHTFPTHQQRNWISTSAPWKLDLFLQKIPSPWFGYHGNKLYEVLARK